MQFIGLVPAAISKRRDDFNHCWVDCILLDYAFVFVALLKNYQYKHLFAPSKYCNWVFGAWLYCKMFVVIEMGLPDRGVHMWHLLNTSSVNSASHLLHLNCLKRNHHLPSLLWYRIFCFHLPPPINSSSLHSFDRYTPVIVLE